MATDNDNFFYGKKTIGDLGADLVREVLKGRQHWRSNHDVNSIIDRENIVCKAQRWKGVGAERKPNRDYEVTAGPCSECEEKECEYKHLEPYPERIKENHEVKTNIATHLKETWGAIKNDGKRFAPSGNLFIEIWQNVKERYTPGHEYSDDRKGWYQKKPLADWYHFYQPRLIERTSKKGNKYIVDITEPEVYRAKDEPKDKFKARLKEYQDQLEQDKKRFSSEMQTNDRLITHRPWPYIVSIRGDKLEYIVNVLCEKDNNGKLKISEAESGKDSNGNQLYSYGYLLPINSLLMNPFSFNKYGTGFVSFTHLIHMVKGTKPSDESKINYYMPATMYDNIFITLPKSKAKGTIKKAKDEKEFVKWLNEAFLLSPNFAFLAGDKMYINAYAELLDNNRVLVVSRPTYNSVCYLEVLPDDAHQQLEFVRSGDALGAFGDAYIPATGGYYTNYAGTRLWGPIYLEQLIYAPVIMLLNEVKKWQ